MIKRLTSLLLVFVLLLSWLPVAALAEDASGCESGCTLEAGHEGACQLPAPSEPPSETTPEDTVPETTGATEETVPETTGAAEAVILEEFPEAEPVLFARWSDGSGYMTEFGELPLNSGTWLCFFFGTQDSAEPLGWERLTVEGGLTLHKGEDTDYSSDTVQVIPTATGNAAVCYTADGITYRFPFTVTEPDPGEQFTEPTLFATEEDGYNAMSQFNGLWLNTSTSLRFFFGTTEHNTELRQEDLFTRGSLILSTWEGTIFINHGEDAKAGDVCYICHTADGVTYEFPVYILGDGAGGDSGDDGSGSGTDTEVTGTFYATHPENTIPQTGLTDAEPGKGYPLTFWLSTDDGTQSVSTELLTVEGCVTLERFSDSVAVIGITADASPGEIGYVCYGDYRFPVQAAGGACESFDWKTTLRYGGEEVTVFVSEIWGEELHDVAGFGDNYGVNYVTPFSRHFLLGALADYNGKSEHLPDKDFYDCISDVSFQLVNSYNEDGNTEPLNCWLSTEPDGSWDSTLSLTPQRTQTELDFSSWQVYVRSNPEMGFHTTLRLTFTYDEAPDDDTEPVTYTVDCQGFYQSSGDVILDASENGVLDTAEEMNAAFASYDSLIAWMNESFPNEAHKFQDATWPGREGGGLITIDLPAVDYEDLIVVQVQSNLFGGLVLRGAADGNGDNLTSMPGLLSRGGIHEIRNIDFIHSSDVTYPGTKGHSFGIMADYTLLAGDGPEGILYMNDICGVHDCTFTGFYYGMCSTGYGYAGFTTSCTISDCEFGIYIDCKGFPAGGNDDFALNTFQGNKTAVCLRNLPGGSTPYSMRFHDNTFLDNHKEFKVTTPGNPHYYYFYRNYYSGKSQDTAAPLAVTGEASFRAALVDTEASNAIVITDPCRTSQEPGSSEDLWVFGDTSILNKEASSLLIAEDALAGNQIAVINDDATQIAVWTFGENEGGNNQ